VIVTDAGAVTPLEIGIQALSLLVVEARRAGVGTFFPKRRMFELIAGDRRLYNQLKAEWNGSRIIAGWSGEVDRFKKKRLAYLLY